MRWCVQADEESILFGVERGCGEFEQRLLRFDSPSPRDPSVDDEVAYVLGGRGAATLAGKPVELAPGTAVYVAAGTGWSIDEAERLEMLSVLIRGPLPSDSGTHAVVAIDEADADRATAGRMFRLL